MTRHRTRTGSFAIGFRTSGSEWQIDRAKLGKWALGEGFSCIDVGASVDEIKSVLDSGIEVGTVDLPHGGGGPLDVDADKRQRAVDEVLAFIEDATAAGATRFFTILMPRQPELDRKRHHDIFYESYADIVRLCESKGAKLAIEGWPGPGVLCCTPESYRATMKHFQSDSVGINYDPSHLVRMRIDPIRFLREFVSHVVHVHGKDCHFDQERLYDLGLEQPPVYAEALGWGGGAWRYTIPGFGETTWTDVFRVLQAHGYQGYVSIELEDENFNGTEAGEQRGFLLSRDHLAAS